MSPDTPATEVPADGALSSPRWPDVPDCHGWLSLDARGRWRLRGERVSHPGLRTFLDENYRNDDNGRWYVANGPQRAFVSLETAPWILWLLDDGALQTHTGHRVQSVTAAWLSDAGSLYLVTDAGPAMLLDAALTAATARIVGADDVPVGDAALEALLAGDDGVDAAFLHGRDRLPLRHITEAAIEHELGFVREPAGTTETDRA